jgi:hypothetical protein
VSEENQAKLVFGLRPGTNVIIFKYFCRKQIGKRLVKLAKPLPFREGDWLVLNKYFREK